MTDKLSFYTDRTLSRPLVADDEAAFCALYTDIRIMRHIAPVMSQQAASKAFARNLANQHDPQCVFRVWAIVDRHSQEFLGIHSLRWTDIHSQQADAGIMLNRNAHGKRLAEECIGGLLSLGFKQLDLERITCQFDARNLAVVRFIQHLGFIIESPELSKQEQDMKKASAYIDATHWLHPVGINRSNS